MQQSPVPISPRSLRRMLFASLAFGALVAGAVGLFAPSLYARERRPPTQTAGAR